MFYQNWLFIKINRLTLADELCCSFSFQFILKRKKEKELLNNLKIDLTILKNIFKKCYYLLLELFFKNLFLHFKITNCFLNDGFTSLADGLILFNQINNIPKSEYMIVTNFCSSSSPMLYVISFHVPMIKLVQYLNKNNK